LRDELLEAGVFHLHVGEHVLAECRVFGLADLESGDNLGIRHNEPQKSGIRSREGGGLEGQNQWAHNTLLYHENLSIDITSVAWGMFQYRTANAYGSTHTTI
jgi:hypothetical protein